MKKHLLTFLAAVGFTAAITTASAQVVFVVQQPGNLAGSYDFTYTDGWGMDMTANQVTGTCALVDDGTAGDSLGCNALVNGAAITGKIAVVYRGDCEFGAKALNAQTAGAIGVIVVNNVSGAPIDMGPGAVGAQVTIPVVMISQADGALLRGAIDAGTLEVFIGTISGLYDNNLSIYQGDIAGANSYTTPLLLTQGAANFQVAPQAWVRNYGNLAQTNVLLSCTITKDGTEVYSETSAAGLSIPASDSALVTLPLFAPASYTNGLYEIEYSISSDATDEYAADNEATTGFYISDDMYTKCRIDPTTNETVTNNGLRPSTGIEFEWCVALQSANAEAVVANGISFSATTSTDAFLTGQGMQLSLYEWSDDISGGTVTFELINPVGQTFYDYNDHTPDVLVRADFENPVALQNNQKYLACVRIFEDSTFLRVDQGINYNTTYDAYPTEVFFPLLSDQWYAGGFGPEYVPGIVLHVSDPNGVAELAPVSVTPFPNPVSDMLNIPIKRKVEGQVQVTVTDAAGRIVMDQGVAMNGADVLRVEAANLANGINLFSLRFADGSTTNFKVMVSR